MKCPMGLRKEILLLAILVCLSTQRSILGKDVNGRWSSRQSSSKPQHYSFVKEASSFHGNGEGADGGDEEEDGSPRFDYIIVGGGTAGCPLAATLSQKFSVLLLERGDSPYGNSNISLLQNFHISLADTSPSSANQPFISTDGVINARARVLGGGSCINAGFYTRASPKYAQDAGWDGDLVNLSYPWIEEKIVHWPKLSPWNQALKDGLLSAGVAPFNGYTYDHIHGTKVGGTTFDDHGHRSTAADLLAAGNSSNLRVLIHASVQRVIFDTSTSRGRPKAIGVVFKDEKGGVHRAFLSRGSESEVVLSSGAVGSPQLLMVSGIGPKEELERKNIGMVLRNEFVGKEMFDNPMNAIFIPTNRPLKQSLIQVVGITDQGSYIEASNGYSQSSDSIRCNHGLMSAEIGQLSAIPPKQRTLEAAQAYSTMKRDLPYEAFQGGFILEKIARPLSRGYISLVTTNIDDNPSITFNYFSHPKDLQHCVYGIRLAEKIAKSRAFASLTQDEYTMKVLLNMSVKANVNLIPKQTNDTASLEQFCRDTVTTIWHYHGGCQVGKVVDADYRVMQVDALRVIDGSVLADSPGTNPQGTVMMLGRYMGVKILRQRLGAAAGV